MTTSSRNVLIKTNNISELSFSICISSRGFGVLGFWGGCVGV